MSARLVVIEEDGSESQVLDVTSMRGVMMIWTENAIYLARGAELFETQWSRGPKRREPK